MRKSIRQWLWCPLAVLLWVAPAGAADVKDRTIKLSYVTANDWRFGVVVEIFAEVGA
jgi:hypothetical protein